MTTTTLHELLDVRDTSLRIERRPRYIRALQRFLSVARGIRFAWLGRLLLTLASFVSTHGLTLFGCACMVISAGIVSPALAWLVAGGAFFFLEARRK